jgi:bifunctional UDP-N-acetylglucosamine pyrophosphorylase/glucosamine-1-phosphate N-acetyltransferase
MAQRTRGVANATKSSDGTFSVLVLAAGKATRFKSQHSKLLHRLAGKPIGEYVLQTVMASGAERVYMVTGHEAAAVQTAFERPGVTFIEQAEQLGTGHALIVSRPEIETCPSATLVVFLGDVPLMRSETMRALVAEHAQSGAAATVTTTLLENPFGYGRIIRAGARSRRKKVNPAAEPGLIKAIVEEKDCTPAEQSIHEVNSGIICFDRVLLLRYLDQLDNNNAQREYLLTDLVAILNRHHHRVLAYPVADSREVMGVNNRAELAQIEKMLRLRKAESLMRDGVTIVDPAVVYIDENVEVGPDTLIGPGVSLLGSTRVGTACTVGAYTIVTDSVIGDRVTILPGCVLSHVQVGADVRLGPFAHLRDGAVLEETARIGNFVEVKKSRIGRGSKSMHLTYLGDATLGEGVNIGAGTITCNYDGKSKSPTTIDSGVFIGSGSMLVAPVHIGTGSYVAAGSTITENVPAESLALGRARQVTKEGWVRERQSGESGPPEATASPERAAKTLVAAASSPESPNADLNTSEAVSGHQLGVREAGSVTIFEITKPLTRDGVAAELGCRVQEKLDAGRKHILVNLGHATAIDSAGVGVLVSIGLSVRNAGGEVRLSNPSPQTFNVLHTAKLQHFFEIHPLEADALKSFSAEAGLIKAR